MKNLQAIKAWFPISSVSLLNINKQANNDVKISKLIGFIRSVQVWFV